MDRAFIQLRLALLSRRFLLWDPGAFFPGFRETNRHGLLAAFDLFAVPAALQRPLLLLAHCLPAIFSHRSSFLRVLPKDLHHQSAIPEDLTCLPLEAAAVSRCPVRSSTRPPHSMSAPQIRKATSQKIHCSGGTVSLTWWMPSRW